MEIFRRYKLVIKIINSAVLNKLESYSRISALGPEGHCRPTRSFKRAMCISCRPHVNVHKGRGSGSCGRMWTGERRVKIKFLVDVINGWTLNECNNKRLK